MSRGTRNLQLSFAGGEMSPEMYSRYDDARLRSGAARLRNMEPRPLGSVARRPGWEHVGEVKDSTREVRLRRFRYSAEQTLMLEMGRATVDGRDIGYFRFHTNGATLLHTQPPDHRPVATATAITTHNWAVGSHSFVTGDPIVFTMVADNETVVAFDTTANTVEVTGHGYLEGEALVFGQGAGGGLPPGLEYARVYYVGGTIGANTFQLKAGSRNGPIINFTTTGAGTNYVAVLPKATDSVSLAEVFLDPNKTYYAMRISAADIRIAETKAAAIAGTPLLDFASIGTVDQSDVNVHYDYRVGDTVLYNDSNDYFPFYCFKIPWGTPGSPYIYNNDHADHGPLTTNYWVRQAGEAEGTSGTGQTLAFTPATNTITWTGHGFPENTPVTFSPGDVGIMPVGITTGTTYYMRNVQTDSFQLSLSAPDPTVHEFSTTGTNPLWAFAGGYYEVPHFIAEDALFEANFAQSNDVLTLVHLDRPVAELRRLGATNWLIENLALTSSVAPPSGVRVTVFAGEGMTIASIVAGPPSVLTCSNEHGLARHDTISVVGAGDIPDGTYIKDDASTTDIELRGIEDGLNVNTTVSTTVTAASRVRPTSLFEDSTSVYAVTATDGDGRESGISATITTTNNLLVNGAWNKVAWEPVAGALRYRVYREVEGLLGFLGEVDAPNVEFVDDGTLTPDLANTAPIVDATLRKDGVVTFDATQDTITWTAHGRVAGAPVTFDTDGTLPTEVVFGTTYYVLNPSADTFQLGATPTSTTPIALSGAGSGRHTVIGGEFPGAVGYFEQRRVFAGSRLRPQSFWLTESGTESSLNYTIPSKDTNRISNQLAALERSQIRHVVSAGHLIMLTSAAEYRLTPLDSDALTPGSVSARAPTHVGVSTVAPVLVNNVVLFPAARGGHVREMGFLTDAGDYVTTDVSLRAGHLFENRTVAQMAVQKSPQPTVWVVSSAGTLLGLNYIAEEQIAGWHEADIDGTIESADTIAEGDEDRTYIVANRGGTKYIERSGCRCIDQIEDVMFLDSAVTYSGTATTTISAPHLANTAITYLADGIKGTATVSAAGVLTVATAASTIHVGLPYTSELATLPIGLQINNAAGFGRTKHPNEVWVRVRNSGGFQVRRSSLATWDDSEAPASGTLLTKKVPVTVGGEWDLDGQLFIQTSEPLPLIIAGLAVEVAAGA